MLNNIVAGIVVVVILCLPFATYKSVRWEQFSKDEYDIVEVNKGQILFQDKRGRMALSEKDLETRYVRDAKEGIYRCWDGHFVKISRPPVSYAIIKEVGSNFIRVLDVYGYEKTIKTTPIVQGEIIGEASLGSLYKPTLLWKYVDNTRNDGIVSRCLGGINIGSIVRASSGIRG